MIRQSKRRCLPLQLVYQLLPVCLLSLMSSHYSLLALTSGVRVEFTDISANTLSDCYDIFSLSPYHSLLLLR